MTKKTKKAVEKKSGEYSLTTQKNNNDTAMLFYLTRILKYCLLHNFRPSQ